MEDIDSLLNTAEVPNLFAADEKAEIMEVRDFFSSFFYFFIRLIRLDLNNFSAYVK